MGFGGVYLAAVIGGEENAGDFRIALVEEMPAHGGLIEGAIAGKKVFAAELQVLADGLDILFGEFHIAISAAAITALVAFEFFDGEGPGGVGHGERGKNRGLI